MSYDAVLRRMVEEHVLLSVVLELTYRCNLNCCYCYNDLSVRGRALEQDDYVRLLNELRAMQVMQLALTGGEPLASPAFWSLGRRARELGFVVRVKSNGHALRGAVARRLRQEIDPWMVEVSLHGARAATHDRQTRVDGSFERLLANLQEMREAGLRVRLICTLTCWNEDQIEDLLALADGLGLQLFFDPVVTPRDDGSRDTLTLAASAGGVERLYRLVAERRRAQEGRAPDAEIGRHQDAGSPGTAGRKNCLAGSSTLTIDPFGNVYPCVQWRRVVGNLHRSSVREIWERSGELAELRAVNEAAGRVVDDLGPAGRQINFCLGLAEELTGDPLKLYPQVERTLVVLKSLSK